MKHTDIDNLVPCIRYFINRKSTPSWNIENSVIDFNDLTFVYSGHALYNVNGVEYTLKRGDFIYITKGSIREAHTYSDNPIQCYAINFDWDIPNDHTPILPFPTTFRTGLFNELLDLYKDLDSVWIEKNPGHILKSRAIFMLILHKLLYINNHNSYKLMTDQRIHKIKEYILMNYNKSITIDDLADIAGLNTVYLGALFKKYNDCSIKEYINRVRINVSENLLCTGGYSVSEAAQLSGFNDIFYFSKVFKKHKGFPPSDTLKTRQV
ncbi:MAG TPA: AraC family transcriptional regulator [Clostridia bacterium]